VSERASSVSFLFSTC